MSRSAIFFDRDNCLIEDPGFVHQIEDLVLKKGAIDLLQQTKSWGFLNIIITNQSGIACGLYDQNEYHQFAKAFEKELFVKSNKKILIDATYFCPHFWPLTEALFRSRKWNIPFRQDLIVDCHCRKPKTGLLEKAQKDWEIDFNGSWMIGDRESDVLCGKQVGCRTIRLGEKNIASRADFVAKDLTEVLDLFIRLKLGID